MSIPTLNEVQSAFNTFVAIADQYMQAARQLSNESQSPIIARIKTTVARHYGISPAFLMSLDKRQHFVLPRHVAMYLARELTSLSNKALAWEFGRKEHGTISYAHRVIKFRMETEPKFKAEIEEIKEDL